jgi:ABC-type glycerol-3-phosphate transport system substrate-binding protein
MKKLTVFFFSFVLLTFFSCKKEDTSPSDQSGSFPLNTQWTGTMYLVGRQFAEPCFLKINLDKTITIYSFFSFIDNNNIIEKDSITATITNIEQANGDINLEIEFPDFSNILETGTLVIKDEQSINYTGANGNFGLYLNKFPDKTFSAEGEWSGPVMTGRYEGQNAYPDLSSIVFAADGSTTYLRQGKVADYGVPQASDYYIIKGVYQQKGPMVWMDGYNEQSNKMIPYFGVFLVSGDTLLVSSRDFLNGRLPTKINGYTDNPYGPVGHTPMIIRQ